MVPKLSGAERTSLSWYCPNTDEILEKPRIQYLFRRSGKGHRVVRLEEPTLSSDISFLWGTYLGIMITAALLFGSGYLVIHGASRPLIAAGYVLLVIGFTFPVYWGLSTIALGRKCTKKKTDAPPEATPPLIFRIGWVTAAKGAGILTGALTVLAVAIFLIGSGTASYLY